MTTPTVNLAGFIISNVLQMTTFEIIFPRNYFHFETIAYRVGSHVTFHCYSERLCYPEKDSGRTKIAHQSFIRSRRVLFALIDLGLLAAEGWIHSEE